MYLIRNNKNRFLVLAIVLFFAHCHQKLTKSPQSHTISKRQVYHLMNIWTKEAQIKNFPVVLANLIYTYTKPPACNLDGFPLTFVKNDSRQGYCFSCHHWEREISKEEISSCKLLWRPTLKEEIHCLCLLNDHQFLVAGDGPVSFCDSYRKSTTPITKKVTSRHQTNTYGICLNDNITYTIVDRQSNVKTYNIKRKSPTHSFLTSSSNHCITRVNERLFGIGSHKSIYFLDTRSLQKVRKLCRCSRSAVSNLTRFDEHTFIFGGHGRVVNVYDNRTWTPIHRINAHNSTICGLMKMEGKEFCSVPMMGPIKIWNINTGKETPQLPKLGLGYLLSAKYLKNGIFAFGAWNTIFFYDRNRKEIIRNLVN